VTANFAPAMPLVAVAASPAEGAMNVTLNATVSVTFNRTIVASANFANITISPNPGGVSASINGSVLIVSHNNFVGNTTYTVGIPTGAVSDPLGTPNAAFNWSFTAIVCCLCVPLPGQANPPTDPDGDGFYEDLNGNGAIEFADAVLFFNQMEWIEANECIAAFDCNGNGKIDWDDISCLFYVNLPLPGCENPPTDPDGDGFYEDLNGNGAKDFDDVVKFFKHLEWIGRNEPVSCFDFNGNGLIDFDDVVRLFWEV